MTQSSLSFNNTYSVQDFKAFNHDNKIDVVKNPNTGKLFFQCGSIRGAVASEIDFHKEVKISEVEGNEGAFFLMHNVNTDNIVASF